MLSTNPLELDRISGRETMATVLANQVLGSPDYPTSDGKPLAETDWHRILMLALIETLNRWFADNPQVYVSGNLLLFYEKGNRRRHVSPDVFVVKGVPKGNRLNYLVWEERKAPDVVIELTSSSTRNEDIKTKFRLYQDILKVQEYFLFDPLEDFLDPSIQGYQLRRGKYQAIPAIRGRIPSKVLGLHLERDGSDLRLFNPVNGERLPTAPELVLKEQLARHQMEAAFHQTLAEQHRMEAARLQAEAESDRLRRELEELRRRLPQKD
jgi:Uma2 family endonuclease